MENLIHKRVRILEREVKFLKKHIKRYEPRFLMYEYIESHGFAVDEPAERRLALQARILMKERGYQYAQKVHSLYGVGDAFPESVLDEVFGVLP